jgi:hypothetical protein
VRRFVTTRLAVALECARSLDRAAPALPFGGHQGRPLAGGRGAKIARGGERDLKGRILSSLANWHQWGGRRDGSGRKPARERRAMRHRPREEFRPSEPVHVTQRMADHVWNLRSQRSFAVIHAALTAARRRNDLRVVDYTILGNHLHLIVEASGRRGLANGMRALGIRLARGLNAMMGRKGPVFEDRSGFVTSRGHCGGERNGARSKVAICERGSGNDGERRERNRAPEGRTIGARPPRLEHLFTHGMVGQMN